jgi:hypothetical protein
MTLFNRQVWGDNGEENERLKEFEGSMLLKSLEEQNH